MGLRPYGRDYQDQAPPAVAYFFSPDRKGEHPKEHLASFNGVLHAEGYAGYKKLYGNNITEAACWAQLRRKFHDVIKIKPSPLADEALQRIGELYEIEARTKGLPPDERQRHRQEHARPRVEALHCWIKVIAHEGGILVYAGAKFPSTSLRMAA